jgi:hypothetical protein
MLGKILTRSAIQQDVEISIRDPRQFASLSGDRDELPLYVQGSVNTSRPDPLTIAVVVNGTVAAVTHSYRDRKTHVFGVLIPETSLRDGDNEVSAFAVDDQTRLKP